MHFSFGDSKTNTIIDCQENINTISETFRCLFITAKEVLTPLKAISATRDIVFNIKIMRAFKESNIKLNFPDVNFFRLADCEGYTILSGNQIERYSK